MTTTASRAGTFRLGGDLEITRLGFGAMRITGDGIWGPPRDRAEALRVLRRLPELGVDFIDTADSYGPYVSEELIAEALAPYDGIVVATKAGLVRTGPNQWHAVGRPEYLRQECEMSLRRLRLDAIPLWQLHRIDRKVPRAEQFGVMKELQDEGKVVHLGLSEVTVDDIREARGYVEIATVQNRYNLTDLGSEDVLRYCEEEGIGFIPWFPLAAGRLAEPGGVVAEIAAAHGATPGQVALAWLLQHSPVMLPIPGTGSVAHLEENVAAAELELSQEEVAALDRAPAA
jgi:aryl-alcohol dehydrogenase-like predicted oxidoreductase